VQLSLLILWKIIDMTLLQLPTVTIARQNRV
jgi:hypothetical protein